MSIVYCLDCETPIDTDYDAEHFGEKCTAEDQEVEENPTQEEVNARYNYLTK